MVSPTRASSTFLTPQTRYPTSPVPRRSISNAPGFRTPTSITCFCVVQCGCFDGKHMFERLSTMQRAPRERQRKPTFEIILLEFVVALQSVPVLLCGLRLHPCGSLAVVVVYAFKISSSVLVPPNPTPTGRLEEGQRQQTDALNVRGL